MRQPAAVEPMADQAPSVRLRVAQAIVGEGHAIIPRTVLWADSEGFIALLGTDKSVDGKGYPTRRDYNGVEREVADAILARLRSAEPAE